MKTKAAIDIGTNTAHLLIGQVQSNKLDRVIHKKRFYTFLGEDGLETINEAAVKRLLEALDQFQITLKNHQCKDVQVIATEGLRAASNGRAVYDEIKHRYGWPISIISGIREAELIFDGVTQAVDLTSKNHLIMDVGGGSVEFISTEEGKKVYHQSFSIGISRLFQKFHQNEPIPAFEVQRMKEWLDEELAELWAYIAKTNKDFLLVGCAGTFEVFLDEDILDNHTIGSSQVPTSRLTDLLEGVLTKDLSERLLVKDLPPERAKYVVVALSLIDYMVKRLDLTSFIVCKYALKEGVLINNF